MKYLKWLLRQNLPFLILIIFLFSQCTNSKQPSDTQAYELYSKGADLLQKYQFDLDNADLVEAKNNFTEAIFEDPELADAYLGLGWVYFDMYYWWSEEFLKKDYLDSVLLYCNKALSIDSGLADAYHLRGKFYSHTGQTEKAIADVRRALKLNRNLTSAHITLGWIYCHLKQDYITGFQYYLEAESMDNSINWPPRYFNDMAYGYMDVGDYEMALFYIHKAIRLQPAILEPILLSSWILEVQGKMDEKLYFIDSIQQKFPDSKACISELAYTYARLGDFEKAEQYYSMVIDTLNMEDRIPLKLAHRLGYVYWNLGEEDKAMEFFRDQINYCNESLASGEGYQTAEYDLAAVYAYLGDQELALKYLEQYAKKGFTYGLHDYIFRDPLFEKLRSNPEFLSIMKPVLENKTSIRMQVQKMRKLILQKD